MTKKRIPDENRRDYGGMAPGARKIVAKELKGLWKALLGWRSYGEIAGYAEKTRSLARLREYLLHCDDAVELTETCRRIPRKP